MAAAGMGPNSDFCAPEDPSCSQSSQLKASGILRVLWSKALKMPLLIPSALCLFTGDEPIATAVANVNSLADHPDDVCDYFKVDSCLDMLGIVNCCFVCLERMLCLRAAACRNRNN